MSLYSLSFSPNLYESLHAAGNKCTHIGRCGSRRTSVLLLTPGFLLVALGESSVRVYLRLQCVWLPGAAGNNEFNPPCGTGLLAHLFSAGLLPAAGDLSRRIGHIHETERDSGTAARAGGRRLVHYFRHEVSVVGTVESICFHS